MNWVVVLYTSSPCESYEGYPCIQAVIGPVTEVEARIIAERQPAWTNPHVMLMSNPEE